MNAAERNLNTSEFSDEQLRVMALSLIPHLNRFGIEERPLRQDEAAKFLGCSQHYLISLRNDGTIKGHRFEDSKIWYYYPSEINRAIRKKS